MHSGFFYAHSYRPADFPDRLPSTPNIYLCALAMADTTEKLTPQWLDSILDTIGETPMVRLRDLSRRVGCTVLAKVEWMNPGLSAKDRIALEVIEQAEKEGKIRPGGTII